MSAFLAGCGVAAAAMVTKYGLQAAQNLKSNPEVARQLGAAAAGFRGMGNAFRMPAALSQFFGGSTAGGFEATMSRREAGQILGISERSKKDEIKKAHRKIMMLNHPDRGGSPYIATKINEAAETLQGGRKSSGSAFS
jgi:DnaJ family protein C protein 19